MKKRNLALVELTLVILFTALSAAVLVRLFAAARQISRESRAQTLGQAMAQDLIERWKAGEEQENLFDAADGWQALPSERQQELLPLLSAAQGADPVPAGGYRLALDETLSPAADGGQTAYRLEVLLAEEAQPAGRLYSIAVRLEAVYSQNELVCFTTARYQPGA